MRIEATHQASEQQGLQLADKIMEALHEYAAVGSGGADALTIQLSVNADSLESAVLKAMRLFRNETRKLATKTTLDVVDVEAETAEHLDARLEAPDPEFVGIAEIADLLDVSRARASAIAARRDFPAPATRLASGPVWVKANLSRWLEEWRKRQRRQTSAHGIVAVPVMLAAKSKE